MLRHQGAFCGKLSRRAAAEPGAILACMMSVLPAAANTVSGLQVQVPHAAPQAVMQQAQLPNGSGGAPLATAFCPIWLLHST